MELVSRPDDLGIAILSLNRPDMLNALSPDLFSELRALTATGNCCGQGRYYTCALELTIACDLLIAADNARFCDTHGKCGMSPT